MEEITRFDMDMDGSMEPSEHGRWVRYEDVPQRTAAEGEDTRRAWEGLTDEEINNFVKAVWPRDATSEDYIRAIEAKLKEKNTSNGGCV